MARLYGDELASVVSFLQLGDYYRMLRTCQAWYLHLRNHEMAAKHLLHNTIVRKIELVKRQQRQKGCRRFAGLHRKLNYVAHLKSLLNRDYSKRKTFVSHGHSLRCFMRGWLVIEFKWQVVQSLDHPSFFDISAPVILDFSKHPLISSDIQQVNYLFHDAVYAGNTTWGHLVQLFIDSCTVSGRNVDPCVERASQVFMTVFQFYVQLGCSVGANVLCGQVTTALYKRRAIFSEMVPLFCMFDQMKIHIDLNFEQLINANASLSTIIAFQQALPHYFSKSKPCDNLLSQIATTERTLESIEQMFTYFVENYEYKVTAMNVLQVIHHPNFALISRIISFFTGDINTIVKRSHSPMIKGTLLHAVLASPGLFGVDICRKLLKRGLDPNIPCMFGQTETPTIVCAARSRVRKPLLELLHLYKLDFFAKQDNAQNTVLLSYSENGMVEEVEFLLKVVKMDPNERVLNQEWSSIFKMGDFVASLPWVSEEMIRVYQRNGAAFSSLTYKKLRKWRK